MMGDQQKNNDDNVPGDCGKDWSGDASTTSVDDDDDDDELSWTAAAVSIQRRIVKIHRRIVEHDGTVG